MMSEAFNPYYKWLGIPPHEQPPNHYRLLGLAQFEKDGEVIEAAADQRMSHLKNYQTGQHSALSQKLLNEVAAAKVCLLSPAKKAAYDQLLQQTAPAPPPVAGPGDYDGPAEDAGADMLAEFAAEAHATRRPLLKQGASRSPLWRRLRAVGIVAVLAGVAVAIFLATNSGTIRIELSDPTADVDLMIDGQSVETAALEEPLKLKTGQHELSVIADDFEPVKQTFTVGWGDNPVIRIDLQRRPLPPGQATAPKTPAPQAQATAPSTQAAPDEAALPNTPAPHAQVTAPKTPATADSASGHESDRDVAKWVFGVGGQLEVELAEGGLKEITSMPEGKFRITRVSLHGKGNVSDEDVARLAGLERLETIELDGTSVTDKALEILSTLTSAESIQSLNIGHTRITGAGLARLAKLSHLTRLDITGTAVDDTELARLPALPRLESLVLKETRITDGALEFVGRFPHLREMDVRRTAVTAQGLLQLRKTLPRGSFKADASLRDEFTRLLAESKQAASSQPSSKDFFGPSTAPARQEARVPPTRQETPEKDERLSQFGEMQKKLPVLYDQMKDADAKYKQLEEEWKPVAANCVRSEREVQSHRNRLAGLQQQSQAYQTAAMAGSASARSRLASVQSDIRREQNDLDRAVNALTPLRTEKATLEAKAREAQHSFNDVLEKWDRTTAAWFSLCDPLVRCERKDEQRAADQFTEWISQQPTFPQLYLARGFAMAHLGQYDRAKEDFDKLGQLDPRPRMQSFAAAARGYTLTRKGDAKEAGTQFALASKLDPKQGLANLLRGQAYMEQKRYLHAKTEFEQALRLCKKAEIPEVYEAMALLLAACPMESVRNGKKAVTYATEACRLTKSEVWVHFDTLGAAHAEAGDFSLAIQAAEKALELAPAENQPAIRQRKALYEKNEPYRLE